MRPNSILVSLLVTFLAASAWRPVDAQQCPRLVDQADYGPATTVAISGTIAVTGFGSVLVVIDVAAPGDPIAVGEVDLSKHISRAAISGTIALATLGVSGTEGVAIVDISTPSSPSLISVQSVDLPSLIYDIAVDGTTVYLATGSAGTKAYTLSGIPSLIPYAEYGTLYTRWVVVDPSTGLVYATGHQTDIIDFSDPTDVNSVATLNSSGIGFGGPFVFLGPLAIGNLLDDGASIWDVSTPATPEHRATIPWPTTNTASQRIGAIAPSTLILSETSAGLFAYDVSSPTSPELLDDSREIAHASEFASYGDRLLVTAADSGLVDLGIDPVSEDIQFGGSVILGSLANSLAMVGSDVYSLTTALWVYEASADSGLTPLGFARSRGWHVDLAVDGDFAIASQLYGDDVHVFDVSDSENPLWRSRSTGLGGDGGAELVGDRGAVADLGGGITEFNVDAPGYVNPPYAGAGVAETSEIAFVPDTNLALAVGRPVFPIPSSRQFFVFDRSAPDSEYTEIGRVELSNPFPCNEIVVSGTTAYVACGELIIGVDFTNPASPAATTVIESWAPGLSFSDIAMAGGFLIVGTSNQGLRVFDATSNPPDPSEVGSYALEEWITSVAADAGPLFVAGFNTHSPMLFSVDQCELHPSGIFSDGFESGNTTNWN